MVKSKVYIGKHISSTPAEAATVVLTERIIVKVHGQPAIPDSALCYIRLDRMNRNMHPEIAMQLQKQWLTWSGTENEYLLINNVRLNQ